MSDESKHQAEETPRRRFKAARGGIVETTGKRGLNRIPQWLTREKGLPDWLAGSLVVVASGLALTFIVWILVLVWRPG